MRLIGLVLALSVTLAPLPVEAQEAGKRWRIGLVFAYSPDLDAPHLAAFRDGLRDLGYVEGKNVVVEARHASIQREKFPELAAELVRSKVDVLVVHGWPAAIRAAEQASSTIPVVFVANPDPIESGIVASLARPGGRVTGLSDFHSELVAKRLELLRDQRHCTSTASTARRLLRNASRATARHTRTQHA